MSNVKDFGALGDGVTDDWAAIMAAITASGVGGSVEFPPTPGAYYRIGQGHSLEPLDGQTWVCWGAVIRKHSNATAQTDNLVRFNGVQNFTMWGGTLGYGSGNHLAVYVVNGGHSDNLRFYGVYFDRLVSSIERLNSNGYFFNCIFEPGTQATAALATGGWTNQTTGAYVNEAGLVRGVFVIGGAVIGGKLEAIDINWDTQAVRIIGVQFVENCTAGLNNEVIDIGGASARGTAISAAGSGYAVNDTVTLAGGLVNGGQFATFTVMSVDGGGAVTDLTMTSGGYYHRFPGETGVATTTSGAGMGLTLNPDWGYCADVVIADCSFVVRDNVEVRLIRIKWETKRVSIHDCVARRPTLSTTAIIVPGSAIRIEQADDITVHDNHWENLYEGYSIQGPSRNIDIHDDTAKNVFKQVLGVGSATSTTDVEKLTIRNIRVLAENLNPTDEAFDLNFLKNARFLRNEIVLANGANVDHFEIRPACFDIEIAGNKMLFGMRGINSMAGATRLFITENNFEGMEAQAIRLQGQNDFTQICRNRVKDTGNDGSSFGIALVDCDDVTLSENHIWDQERGFQFLTGGVRVTVQGNKPNVTTTPWTGVSALTAPIIKDNDGYITEAFGMATGTTDGSGDLTVTHGLSVTPTNVCATSAGTTLTHVQAHTLTSTTFKLRFLDAVGNALVSTASTAYWEAAG